MTYCSVVTVLALDSLAKKRSGHYAVLKILSLRSPSQSQKTQGFCVADFATLCDETRSRSKLFPLFIWIKEPCVRTFEGLERSKLLGISETKVKFMYRAVKGTKICSALRIFKTNCKLFMCAKEKHKTKRDNSPG